MNKRKDLALGQWLHVVLFVALFSVSASRPAHASSVSPRASEALGAGAFSPSAVETTVVLQQGADAYDGCEDTSIYQYAPDSNYCSLTELKVGYRQRYAALLRFDLSPIPADAVVIQATLELYAKGWSGSNMTLAAYAILRSTDLCQASWNQASSGDAWTVPGCDDTTFDCAPTPVSSVTTSGVSKWYAFDVSSLLQDWLDGSQVNNGVLLRGSPQASGIFYFASAQNGLGALRPRLVVRFQTARRPTAVPTAIPVSGPPPVWPMFRYDGSRTGQGSQPGPAAPRLRWRYPTGGAIHSSPAIASDGTILVGSRDGSVYAINSNGTLRWRYQARSDIRSSPAIGTDGTVYIGSDDGYLYALNPDGSLEWRYLTGDAVRCSPGTARDHTVYVASEDGYLYAIDWNGTLKWRVFVGQVSSAPAIGADGTIYVGSDDGYLYAVLGDGQVLWRYHLSGPSESSPAIASDGTIVLGSSAGYVHARRPDGTSWRYLTAAAVGSSPAIGIGGTVYVGADDGFLYALNADGTLQWRSRIGDRVHSSPSLGNDGTIYVGSSDNYVYAISPYGSPVWRYRTGGTVSSSPALGADGTLYIGSDDGYVYALSDMPYTTVALQHGRQGYAGAEDTYINDFAPDASYCSLAEFKVGYRQHYAALLRFELPALPDDAVITQATLRLYAKGWTGSNMTVSAFRILRSTDLCQASWNDAADGIPWSIPGCNNSAIDCTALPESSVTTDGVSKWYALDLTAVVQDWLDGNLTNRGILLRGSSSQSSSIFYFASAQNAIASLRPELLMTYHGGSSAEVSQ